MVTLSEAMNHCRRDGLEEFETIVQRGLDAAIDHLSSIDVDMTADPLPPAIRHAVLLLVSHFVENIGATNAEQLRFTPLGVDRLIAPYREVSL